MLVTTDPLAVLNAVVVSVLAAVLGLRLAASLAWEREHHTMEVLLVRSRPPTEAIFAVQVLRPNCSPAVGSWWRF